MKKRGIIFLILVFIFLISLLFGKMTGKVISSFESCKDSDNGLNYYTKGEINGISYSVINLYKGDKYNYEDYCIDNKKLVEFYCVSESSDISFRKESVIFDCKEGCQEGMCIGEPDEESKKFIVNINRFV